MPPTLATGVTLVSSSTTLHLNDVDVELVERGSGPALLFLHDETATRGDAPFVELLAHDFRVLAPSHPGFGRSSLPEDFDSVEDLAYFYLDLIEVLQLEDALLAGASFGGWLAAELAIRCAHRLRGLVLVDPLGIKPGDRESRDIADVFALSPDEVLRRSYHQPEVVAAPSSLSDEELIATARNRAAFALYAWEPYAHNPKLLRRLHRIQIPTLVLWGENDGIVTPAYGGAFARAIPNSTMEVISRAGHLPHIEQAEEFARRVRAFAACMPNESEATETRRP
jgi:pimeloyl-ACP methyl ester carboxylesterase